MNRKTIAIGLAILAISVSVMAQPMPRWRYHEQIDPFSDGNSVTATATEEWPMDNFPNVILKKEIVVGCEDNNTPFLRLRTSIHPNWNEGKTTIKHRIFGEEFDEYQWFFANYGNAIRPISVSWIRKMAESDRFALIAEAHNGEPLTIGWKLKGHRDIILAVADACSP